MNKKSNTDDQPKSRYDTPEQIARNFAAWRDAMELSYAMLMAGLRMQIGPDGDLKQAWRKWNAESSARKMRDYELADKRWRERRQQEHLASTEGK